MLAMVDEEQAGLIREEVDALELVAHKTDKKHDADVIIDKETT